MNLALKCSAIVLALAAPLPAIAQDQPQFIGWMDKGDGGDDWQASKAKLQALGEQFDTAMDLYDFFKEQSGGAETLTFEQIGSDPAYDWSGVFTRTGGGLSYDPEVKSSEITAQLTDEGAAARQAKIDQIASTGGEYDPISDCRPPGFPRWLTEPFLKDYVVTPDETWLMNEMVNDVRRIYTDGREHTPAADAYPTWNGDSIGFWNDGMLYTHTMYLNPGQYQRGTQPNYSDQVEVVERWKKVDDHTLRVRRVGV